MYFLSLYDEEDTYEKKEFDMNMTRLKINLQNHERCDVAQNRYDKAVDQQRQTNKEMTEILKKLESIKTD